MCEFVVDWQSEICPEIHALAKLERFAKVCEYSYSLWDWRFLWKWHIWRNWQNGVLSIKFGECSYNVEKESPLKVAIFAKMRNMANTRQSLSKNFKLDGKRALWKWRFWQKCWIWRKWRKFAKALATSEIRWQRSLFESSDFDDNRDLTRLRRRRQEERQKSNRFNEQNNNSARASRFFDHFFADPAKLRREMTEF